MWFDLVSTGLENCGYAVGQVVLPSAGLGAPNIRHRRYWLADAERERRAGGKQSGEAAGEAHGGANANDRWFARVCQPAGQIALGWLVLPDGTGCKSGRSSGAAAGYGRSAVAAGGACRLGDAEHGGLPDPAAQDAGGEGGVKAGERLEAQAAHVIPGASLNGLPASTESRGLLNPRFSAWLQGIPPEWDTCAPLPTRKARKGA